MGRHRDSGEDLTQQLAPLIEDDEFLTALSHGEDPSGGDDELAGLLLGLRSDVEKQMPPAPVIEGEDDEPAVIAMPARRRRVRPLLHGLVGAAAATVLIAGGGAVLTGSGVLGGGAGGNATAVELAGTLDELDRSTAEGDDDATRALLDEARRLVDKLDAQEQDGEAAAAGRGTSARSTTATETATATETVTEPAPAPAPQSADVEPAPAETVTVTSTAPAPEQATVTQYATVTETVVRENPLPFNEPEPAPGDTPGGGAPQQPEQ